ncbi:hypothetical protein, partial [Streptomyces sp. H27-D2]|uniref:hypothetical protein n=1 Tax=Streptomyces sp. H27-D2 TaxID=3046304 RepID=UPI002DB99E55
MSITGEQHDDRAARVMRRLGIERPRGLAVLAVLAACLVTMPVAAVCSAGWVFAVAGLLGYAADWYLHHREPDLMSRLGRLRAGVTIRFQLRTVVLMVLLVQLDEVDQASLTAAMVLVLCLLAAHSLHVAMITTIRRHRRLAVATRNIDLSALHITDRPPRLLTDWPGQRLLQYELVVLLGLVGTLIADGSAWVLAGLAVAVGGCLLTLAALLPYAVQALRFPGPGRVLAEVDRWLARRRPQTALYFSGSHDSAYQVNMWLDTMAGLGTRPLVILRERHLLEHLKPTSLPVLCVPSAVHLMNLDLSSVRVALYPANVGKNIHLLRVPTIQHVFVGHGDSDKIASVNPYSKVYDEVWVAGEAGRHRYAEAAVGVADADVVEVGRPQLDEVGVVDDGRPEHPVPTVLYAPTWEGWTDEPGNTSLILAGENIVRRLLASDPPVRVIYKPHPFTGNRSARARAAHERVIAMIAAANDARTASGLFPEPREAAALRAGAARRRDELADRIAALESRLHPGGVDEAVLTRDSAVPDPALQAEAEELREQWQRAHWEASAPGAHQVIEGPAPNLYNCFDQADLLISDISSVVSDFIVSLKPYALADTAELGDEEFRRQNTAARAAYLLRSDAAGVDRLVRLLFDPALDELRTARHQLKAFLLGPEAPASTRRFNDAIGLLAAKGQAVIRLRELNAPELNAPDAAMPETGLADADVPAREVPSAEPGAPEPGAAEPGAAAADLAAAGLG